VDACKPDLSPLLAAMDGMSSKLDAARGNAPTVAMTWDASKPDLSRIEQALAAVSSKLEDAAKTSSPAVDLAPVLSGLTAVGSKVDACKPDLSPLLAAMDGMSSKLDAARGNAPTVAMSWDASKPDLSPILQALEGLSVKLDAAQLSEPVIDLSPILISLTAVGSKFDTCRPDLSPILKALEVISSNFEVAKTSAPAVDLSPVLTSLTSVGSKLDASREETKATMTAQCAPLTAELQRLSKALSSVAEVVDKSKVDLAPLKSKVEAILPGVLSALQEGQADDVSSAMGIATIVRESKGELLQALAKITEATTTLQVTTKAERTQSVHAVVAAVHQLKTEVLAAVAGAHAREANVISAYGSHWQRVGYEGGDAGAPGKAPPALEARVLGSM